MFSACLKKGISVIRKGNAGEMREAEGQDAEHGGLPVLAKADKGVTCLAQVFQGCLLCGG